MRMRSSMHFRFQREEGSIIFTVVMMLLIQRHGEDLWLRFWYLVLVFRGKAMTRLT